mgnify:CR=1 FL=1
MPEDLAPLWVSLNTALVATLLATGLGIGVARWMLSYQGRARGVIDGIFTLPLVLPPTVVGFLLLLLVGKNGPVGQLLHSVGITIIFTRTALVLAATVVAFPLVYRTVLGAFEQVDQTLLGSARTLGASEWRIFWQLLLPLAWPGVLAGTVLAFARALGEFGATLMVGGSIPGVTQTIPIAIFFAAEGGRMGVALAWVLLMVVVSLAVIAGINYGNRRPAQKAAFTNALVKRWFNWLYFRRWTGESLWRRSWEPSSGEMDSTIPDLGGDRPSAARPLVLAGSGGSSPAATPLETEGVAAQTAAVAIALHAQETEHHRPEAAALHVQIEKQIPGFHLQVDFQADRQPLGLLGASGSGKSMTLRCIAGLETPTRGQIILNGRVLFDAHRRINLPSRDRKVGLVFQNYALFPHLTVAQNIAFGMQKRSRRWRLAEVVNYLDRMGLAGLGDRYPYQLSGGQQQRVALARALAIQPDILLLDEPLSALDTHLRSQVEKLLVDVLSQYQGVTLFITHKLEEAYRLCPKLAVLSGGQILAMGPKEAIFRTPPTLAVAQITECKNIARARPTCTCSIEALDWGCSLEVSQPLPPDLHYVGLRAHHVQILPTAELSNTFPGWLAAITETQHRVSLYLKLHSPPRSPQDYHLQAEIYREKWEALKTRPFPWNIYLNPARLMVMSR